MLTESELNELHVLDDLTIYHSTDCLCDECVKKRELEARDE